MKNNTTTTYDYSDKLMGREIDAIEVIGGELYIYTKKVVDWEALIAIANNSGMAVNNRSLETDIEAPKNEYSESFIRTVMPAAVEPNGDADVWKKIRAHEGSDWFWFELETVHAKRTDEYCLCECWTSVNY